MSEEAIMQSSIDNLNKAFDNRVRLGIMSALMVNDELNFNQLKELLKITDGNLASHLKALEDNGYIVSSKRFIGRRPNTDYKVTPWGRTSFKSHLEALEKMIRGIN